MPGRPEAWAARAREMAGLLLEFTNYGDFGWTGAPENAGVVALMAAPAAAQRFSNMMTYGRGSRI